MDSDNLIRMANRIGDFFEAMPDRPEALEGIAVHIKKFWEPRMRRQFLALMDSEAGQDIKDIVRTAVTTHRAMLA
jgi:formate dehydrogenase subunit delta